jgi:hypothetical protein
MKKKKPEAESAASKLPPQWGSLGCPLCCYEELHVALIEEPWTYKGEIKGLKEVGGEVIYSRSIQHPRTRILVKKDFRILLLMHHCSGHLMAMKIKMSCSWGPREIILGSTYLPYDAVEPPRPGDLESLVMRCRAERTHLIIGCDANAHHG